MGSMPLNQDDGAGDGRFGVSKGGLFSGGLELKNCT